MLRTVSPNISIITNFGCRLNCWYCIWNHHKFKNVKKLTNWNKLFEFLYQYKEKGKVSISGGGDCLYDYDNNIEWWNKVFKVTEDIDMLIDVHTREKFYNEIFWKKINRCVFSVDIINDDIINYLKYLSKLTKIRIVHVVTESTSIKMIKEFIKFQKEINCQFTLKELSEYDEGGNYNFLKIKYPDLYYLDKGDYNIYFMPDNEIYDCFIE
jgi:hypothetical protein